MIETMGGDGQDSDKDGPPPWHDLEKAAQENLGIPPDTLKPAEKPKKISPPQLKHLRVIEGGKGKDNKLDEKK